VAGFAGRDGKERCSSPRDDGLAGRHACFAGSLEGEGRWLLTLGRPWRAALWLFRERLA